MSSTGETNMVWRPDSPSRNVLVNARPLGPLVTLGRGTLKTTEMESPANSIHGALTRLHFIQENRS